MKRTVIRIDEEKCDGCEECVNGCHEGALQMIDGKARLVSELYCDGLGACIGECHAGAITLEEREAEPYSETAVMERISANGTKTIIAHLKHLRDHDEMAYFNEGIEYLKRNNINVDLSSLLNENKNILKLEILDNKGANFGGGCPGSRSMEFAGENQQGDMISGQSELTHWPIQFHLINPMAPHFKGADLLLAADCAAFTAGNFHGKFLAGKKLVIACPKLDSNKEIYFEKLKTLIDDAKINTINVLIMEVPCCGGLLGIAEKAVESAGRKVPVKYTVISIRGEVLEEEWL